MALVHHFFLMIQVLQQCSWKLKHAIKTATCARNNFIIIPKALIYRILTDYRGYNIAYII